MGIDDKPAALWTEEDLAELCREHRRESARLEFKRELSLDTRADKFEVERDAHGMANSGGGYIIYGIAEAAQPDGTTGASELMPLADGSLYERLNNVLDSRGEPRLPFDIHSIPAAAGGSYLVVEIFGHHRPHRSSDRRYYVRRNLLVREMNEGEIAEAYRDRFIRQASALGLQEQERGPGPAEEARRDQRELLRREFALYRAETGADTDPGWLSVLAIPTEAEGTLIDPLRIEPLQLRELSEGIDRWRPEESPLTHFRLQRTTLGFYGQLPDRDDTYPRYLVRFWRNGVMELGDLLEPMFPIDEDQRRTVPSAAVVEYTHDFLLLAHQVYALAGYDGEVEAEARLENIAGYALAVRRGYDMPNRHPFDVDIVSTEPWRGSARELNDGAVVVARELADYMFLAAGAGRPYFFRNGRYARED
jgi:Putative DNA-binding domain